MAQVAASCRLVAFNVILTIPTQQPGDIFGELYDRSPAVQSCPQGIKPGLKLTNLSDVLSDA